MVCQRRRRAFSREYLLFQGHGRPSPRRRKSSQPLESSYRPPRPSVNARAPHHRHLLTVIGGRRRRFRYRDSDNTLPQSILAVSNPHARLTQVVPSRTAGKLPACGPTPDPRSASPIGPTPRSRSPPTTKGSASPNTSARPHSSAPRSTSSTPRPTRSTPRTTSSPSPARSVASPRSIPRARPTPLARPRHPAAQRGTEVDHSRRCLPA